MATSAFAEVVVVEDDEESSIIDDNERRIKENIIDESEALYTKGGRTCSGKPAARRKLTIFEYYFGQNYNIIEPDQDEADWLERQRKRSLWESDY
ncbi:MAG TPA: hypothetical protein PK123_07150 [Bacteroidales bacterium]|nr:hypothetical protein [Bacteroidales bacterium]HQN24675.1 hypothetical protein [Bacteroidales bacterium]